ncbi:MAG TPA: nucleoside hydrolase [Candidatus Sulfotelmatobacter sp.]|nr:nucleoside hydrolase [Candidatus Sulfotelmatobacter sp.]
MNPQTELKEQSRRTFLVNSAGLLAAGAMGGLPLVSSAAPNGSAGPTPFAGASSVHRIILDTDPGVDDAMAILLALRSPELKVEAVTPVAGNVPLDFTLPNAMKLLELAGRSDIPVAAGASTPLVRSLVTAKAVHGSNGLGGVELPAPKMHPVSETASELIRRIVRANPGEISIVAVGPLTNVATALRSDPALAAMIRSIVVMGGSLSRGNVTPAAEFNFYVDPEAARIVFDARVPLTMVGLDVTRKALIGQEHLKVLDAARTPMCDFAAKIMRATMARWSKDGGETIALHDPLTVASLIDPEILKFRDYYVLIETSGEASAGQSLGYSEGPVRRSAPLETAVSAESTEPFRPNAQVAVDVDPERFFRLLLSRLTSAA